MYDTISETIIDISLVFLFYSSYCNIFKSVEMYMIDGYYVLMYTYT